MINLEKALGHQFTNPMLLDQALTHRSCGKVNNERLEFLGDSILNFVVAELIFENFKTLPEGNMSRTRSAMVREDALVKVAHRLDIASYIKVTNEDKNKEVAPSILADAVEAIFAAVYMDAGFVHAKRVINNHMVWLLNNNHVLLKKDPKTSLQEFLQKRKYPLPAYKIVRISENSDNRFEVECFVEQLGVRALATGSTRKIAESHAAQKALHESQQRC